MSACTALPASIASQCVLEISRCKPRARAAMSMPRISSEKNSPYSVGSTMPIVWVRRVMRLCAPLFGTYCRRAAASSTRVRMLSVTTPVPFRARETDAMET